jgi:hypothetical protein
MKATLVLLVVFILAVSEAVAQEPPPRPAELPHPPHTAQQGQPAKPAEPPQVEVAQIPIGTRVGAPPSGYDGGGRRDPFMSLIYSRRSPSAVAVAPRSTGLPSISITDARVTGILRSGQNFIAIIEGPDKLSYSARPKDRLLDAVVKSIDAKGVVFVEQSEMTGPGREVRKPLRRAAEDNR